MGVQLQQLRYFLAVAETRHFTQAADMLDVSQPTLSKQIHTLEATLGTSLFERIRGAVTLTAAGETLLPFARRMIADADAARDEVRDIIEKNWKGLQDAWDKKYPSNPISSKEEDDDEDR